MADLLSSTLLAAAIATNTAGPLTNLTNAIDPATGFTLPAHLPQEAIERAYAELLALDDEAQTEIDRWIQQADAQRGSADPAALQKRIQERLAAVAQAYRAFLQKHPDHVEGRIAFGSFLNDTGQEQAAREQWERARELDPKNPAIYNNLAGIYGHRGPVTNAFVHYEKAIELDPTEPVYYHNLATTVFLFRRDVMEHYGITDEQKVFDKALALYHQALELDPGNFILASDLAQTYYLIKPPRHEDAIVAWQRAYELAGDDLERESVRVHLARIHGQASRFEEAWTQLNLVTNTQLDELKGRVGRTLRARQQAILTNAPAARP
jgi:tetratricopeptide (TPR) repeat protein